MVTGLGCLDDSRDDRDWDISAISDDVLPPGSYYIEADNYVPMDNQFRTNACVAFAICAAVEIRERELGLKVSRASKRFLYYIARARQMLTGVDKGCSVRSALYAASHLGIAPESDCPFSVECINDPMPMAAVIRAGDRSGLQYGFSSGASYRFADITRAVAQGQACVVALKVDRDFMEHRGSDLIDQISEKEIVGGHLVTAVGYTANAVLIRNSWGADWRNGGRAWISRDLLESRFCTSVASVDGWRALALAR